MNPRASKSAILVAMALALAALPAAAQVDLTLTAAPGTVSIAPGVSANGWFYDGQLPGPLIRVTEGQTVRVRLVNALPEDTSIHWHGLPVPSGMDGVPGLSRPAIPSGQEFSYEFVAGPAGTYFFHPHVGLQLDRGLYAPLIVDPVTPPLPAPARDYVIVLDDWLGTAPVMTDNPPYTAWLINGRTSAGQTPLAVQAGELVKLRFINASAATHYVVALDGHALTVTHTDGRPIVPVTTQAIPIGAGERYDAQFVAGNPGTWSLAASDISNRGVTRVRAVVQYAGSTAPIPSASYVPPFLASGSLLSYAQMAAAGPVAPISPAPTRSYPLTLFGGMMMFTGWTINGQAWPNVTPLDVQTGDVVRLVMTNMSMQRHPMHLHGHFFRLLGTAGGTTAPVVKDTVLLAPGMMMFGTPVSVEFVADNPGNWALHCHNIYHMEMGMMTRVRFVNGDADADGLLDGFDLDPSSAYPVLTADGLGGGFANGTPIRLDLQWPDANAAWFFAGVEQSPPIDLGAMGALRLSPFFLLGTSTSVASRASLLVPIPADPALAGAIAPLQALAAHASLAPGGRISIFQRLRIH